MYLDLEGECEGGCAHREDLPNQVASGECLPRSGDCGAGIVGSCESGFTYAMGWEVKGYGQMLVLLDGGTEPLLAVFGKVIMRQERHC